MSNVLRLAIVDPSDSARDALKTILLGLEMVWLEAECSRYEFFADVVAQTHPDIGLVAIDKDPDKALQLVEQLSASSPQCSVLVVSASTDGNLILRAMRAGAKEFLPKPIRIEDLVASLERIRERRFGHGDAKTRGSTVIAIAGATGGVGTTSVAVNLGCILAKDPQNSVALVDLDLSLGDADVFLDTIPDYSLVDVAQNVTRLDFTLLKRSLTKHSSGLVSVAAAGAIGRRQADHAGRSAARDRAVEGDVHAFDHRLVQVLQRVGHGRLADGQPHPAGHAVGSPVLAKSCPADDVVRRESTG